MEMFKGLVSGLVNFCRGLVRPVVTVGLVALVCFLGIEVWRLIAAAQTAGQLTSEQLLMLATMVLQFIFTITASAVAFWFAERKTTGGNSTPSG